MITTTTKIYNHHWGPRTCGQYGDTSEIDIFQL